jgi:hypothetical protein
MKNAASALILAGAKGRRGEPAAVAPVIPREVAGGSAYDYRFRNCGHRWRPLRREALGCFASDQKPRKRCVSMETKSAFSALGAPMLRVGSTRAPCRGFGIAVLTAHPLCRTRGKCAHNFPPMKSRSRSEASGSGVRTLAGLATLAGGRHAVAASCPTQSHAADSVPEPISTPGLALAASGRRRGRIPRQMGKRRARILMDARRDFRRAPRWQCGRAGVAAQGREGPILEPAICHHG